MISRAMPDQPEGTQAGSSTRWDHCAAPRIGHRQCSVIFYIELFLSGEVPFDLGISGTDIVTSKPLSSTAARPNGGLDTPTITSIVPLSPTPRMVKSNA
jgi:hypothetical protein